MDDRSLSVLALRNPVGAQRAPLAQSESLAGRGGSSSLVGWARAPRPPAIVRSEPPDGQNQLELPFIPNDQDDEYITGGNIPGPLLSALHHNLLGIAVNIRSNNSTEENHNVLDVAAGDEEEELFRIDPSIIGINDQQTAWFNAPNVAPYALAMVLTLLGVVVFCLKQGYLTPFHIAKPLMILIVVGLGIAYLTSTLLSWINDHPDYKMVKGLYYIGCNIAFITLLVVLYTSIVN